MARATQLSGTDAGVIYEYDEQREVFVPRATENREGGVRPPGRLHHQAPDLRGHVVGRTREERVAVDDLHDAIGTGPIREVDAVTGGPQRDGAVDRSQ